MKIAAYPFAKMSSGSRRAKPLARMSTAGGCNNAYTAYQAIDIARKLEPYDIFWFEEPVAPDDYRGHAQVTRATSVPIATGENEYTRYGFRDLIAHEAADILNPDAQILGGITEFMHVASLAAAHDLKIAPHGAQEVHIHLVTAISNGLILEVYRETVDPLRSQIFKERLALDADGSVVAPDRPGLGWSRTTICCSSTEWLNHGRPHQNRCPYRP